MQQWFVSTNPTIRLLFSLALSKRYRQEQHNCKSDFIEYDSYFKRPPVRSTNTITILPTDHTPGYIFTAHYVAWGRVANTGGTSSSSIMYKQYREQKGLLLLRVSSICFDLIKLYYSSEHNPNPEYH
jgi:hypothetical protein